MSRGWNCSSLITRWLVAEDVLQRGEIDLAAVDVTDDAAFFFPELLHGIGNVLGDVSWDDDDTVDIRVQQIAGVDGETANGHRNIGGAKRIIPMGNDLAWREVLDSERFHLILVAHATIGD